jgi:hypothetical protein
MTNFTDSWIPSFVPKRGPKHHTVDLLTSVCRKRKSLAAEVGTTCITSGLIRRLPRPPRRCTGSKTKIPLLQYHAHYRTGLTSSATSRCKSRHWLAQLVNAPNSQTTAAASMCRLRYIRMHSQHRSQRCTATCRTRTGGEKSKYVQ